MESIARLMAELPKVYEKDCFEQGAITRRRGVANSTDLMMLSMFHLQNGCTLLEISEVADNIPAEEILETYRLRWQVEIYFKRLKSILDFGELPKRRPDSVIAWLNGKLMIALLIEILLSKTAFSLKRLPDRSIWREIKFLNLWLVTGFCGDDVLFSELENTLINLKVEKRKRGNRLQLSNPLS